MFTSKHMLYMFDVMFTEKGTKRLNMLVKTLLLRRTKNQTDPGGKPLVSIHSLYRLKVRLRPWPILRLGGLLHLTADT